MELSDAEVFGATPPPQLASAAPAELSDAEVFGGGTPAPQAAAPPTEELSDDAVGLGDSPGILAYAKENLKDVAVGAAQLGTSAVRGAGYLVNAPQGPEEQNARTLELLQSGQTAEQAAATLRGEQPTKKQIADSSLVKAGTAGDKALESVLGPGPGFEGQSFRRDLARGAGSLVGGLGLGLVNPLLAGATFTLGGAGQSGDQALNNKKANAQQTSDSATLGTIAGATDLLDLTLPYLGSLGKAAGFIRKVGVRALESALVEGGQEGVQQLMQNSIAKGLYDPAQDVMEGVTYNALIGALLGGGAGAVIGGHHDKGTTPSKDDVNGAAETLRTTPPLDSPNGGAAAMASSAISPDPTPMFYSNLRKVVEEKGPNAASPEQWLGTLRNNPGIKQEELDATGVEGYLIGQEGKVSKDQLLQHLEENSVQLNDTVRGPLPDINAIAEKIGMPPNWRDTEYMKNKVRDAYIEEATLNPTVSYAGHVAPGGTNYREVTLSLPKSEEIFDKNGDSFTPKQGNFESSHWETPNVISHARFDQRDVGGTPALHIQEIQSDWHQRGRQKGYTTDTLEMRLLPDGWYGIFEKGAFDPIAVRPTRETAQERVNEGKIGSVPNAPFKSSWPELTLKRLITYASRNGISRISWNNGDLAARYATGGNPSQQARAGLHEFYDKVIPSVARKLAKRLGGTYGEAVINPVGDNHRIGYIDLPSRAQQIVREKGLPLFSKKVPGPPASLVATPAVLALHDAGDKFVVAAVRAVQVLKNIAKEFKLDAKIRIVLQENLSSKGTNAETLTNIMTATQHVDGSYSIRANMSMFANVGDFYASLLHEFGHIVMWEHFDKLGTTKKLEILAAHEKFIQDTRNTETLQEFLNRRDNPVVVFTGLRGDSAELLRSLPPDQRHYWMHFEEWFAEQVAKWGTTNEAPLSIVEKTMAYLGKALRKILLRAQEQFGLSFHPDKVMADWLNSFMVQHLPLAAEIMTGVDAKTQDENRAALDKAANDIPAQPQQPVTIGPKTGIDNVFRKIQEPPELAEFKAHADRMNRFYKWMAGLDQLVDANPNFTPLLRYAERVREMHSEEAKIQDAAIRVGKAWRKLGVQGENLTALIDDITNMVYRTDDEVERGVARHPTNEEFGALVARHKASKEALAVFTSIKKMFDGFLQLVEQNAKAEAVRLISDQAQLAARLDQITAMVDNLRSRPYFPFMRFGRHFVQVKDGAGNTVHFETFERRGFVSAEARQRAKAAQLQAAAQPGETVAVGVLPESVDPLIGMPPLLLQAMRERLELTPQQLDALEQLQFEVSPALSFKHRFQHKNYTVGYSMDFKRSFARYFFHGARFYSRTKYAWALRDDIKTARQIPGNKEGDVANFMADHLKNTVLDSKGDFGIFKGAIFFWALGYVPAAAAQNLTQTPMITYPFLAAKFGDIAAPKAIIKAMSDLSNFYKKGAYDNQSEFEYRAFGYGIKTGRISETQAPELAGMAQGANLLEGMGGNKTQRGWQLFQEKAAWMFEMAEQFNRRVAYRAALDLAQKQPNAKVVNEAVAKYNDEYRQLLGEYTEAQARAIVTANHTVDQTQYVYARYARPRFMRGRLAGTLLVFKKYMQSTLFMLGHNKSDVLPRYLLVAALLGGAGGMPGYDDLRDILRALAYHLFGKDFNLDRKVREYVTSLTGGAIPPDMVLHGFARRGFGVPALLDMIGSFATGKPGRGFDPSKQAQNVPFPVVDRSNALSMGNILPFEVGKLFVPQKDVNSTIADQTQRASGAAFSVAFNIYKAISDNSMEVSDPKRWERAVPRLLGSTSKAFRAYSEGRDRSRGGPQGASTIANFDPRDTEQMMEILAMAAGYQPLRVQAKWDSIMAKNEVQQFYDLQRSALLQQMHEAMAGHNPKEIADVRDSILKFNRELPAFAKGKSLTSETINQSVQAREKARIMREAGVPSQRTNVGISREMDRLYPEATVDVRRVRQ